MEKHELKDLESFTVRPYRSKRLQENNYFCNMGKDNLSVLTDPWVKEVLEAQGFAVEYAPRSVYKVDKLFEALAGYARGKNHKVAPSDELSSGIALAYSCFARKSGQSRLQMLPLTPATIKVITSNPGGSPGLTNYGTPKAQSETRALERGALTLRGLKQPEPCLAFKRTQFNDKTRLVWGYPYSMTVIEGLVAYPILQKYKQRVTPMAFAIPKGTLGTKLRVASYHHKYAYSIDMSQFDATIPAKLIHLAFKIIRTWFDMDQVEPTTGKTCRDVFKLIERFFIHTTIVMPDGHIYIGKDHGVPSGSYFTQMVDSIVNVIVCGAMSAKFNLSVSKREVFVLGDDLMFWTDRLIDLDVLARYVNRTFGLKMHGNEKSKIFTYKDKLHYIGLDWDNGLPTLDINEVIKRMLYTESYRKYPKERAAAIHQLHLMLLSYASTYRSAWSIAYNAIDPSNRNINRGCANTDVNVYIFEAKGSRSKVDPNQLSGLARYKLLYLTEDSEGDIPNTAMQYWL